MAKFAERELERMRQDLDAVQPLLTMRPIVIHDDVERAAAVHGLLCLPGAWAALTDHQQAELVPLFHKAQLPLPGSGVAPAPVPAALADYARDEPAALLPPASPVLLEMTPQRVRFIEVVT